MKSFLGVLLAALVWLPSLGYAGNDCTEWLGTWSVKTDIVFYDDSTGYDPEHWEITQADQYVAYGQYWNEATPQFVYTITIVWSASRGAYIFTSDNYGDSVEIELTILGSSFTGHYEYPDPSSFFHSYTFTGTKIGATNTPGTIVIENNADLTITGAGLGGQKIDCVLKCYVDPENPLNVFWFLDPASVKLE